MHNTEERQGPTVEDVSLYLIFEIFMPNSEKKEKEKLVL